MIKFNFNAIFGFGMFFLLSSALLVSAIQAQEAEPGSIEDQPTTQPQQKETLPAKVSLSEEKTFQGIIVDAQGEPVSGTLNMLLEGRSVHTTETDSSGVFMIANVEPGIYQLASVSQDLVGNQLVDISYQTGQGYLPQAEVVVHPISDGATVEGFCNECATGVAQEEIVYARSCGCSGGGGGFVSGGGSGHYLVVPVVLDDCLVVPVVLDDCFLAQDVYCFSVVLQPQLRLARPITMTTTQRQPRLARNERVDD